MKIYVAHSRDYDYEKMLYTPILKSSLSKKYEFIFPHLANNSFNSKNVIESCDLFIAEVSKVATGTGIEIGRAEMMSKKILFIYMENAKISSSLKYVEADMLEYTSTEDLINKLEQYLESMGK